ncbi:MAG: 2OG-Fe(II) oxygenase [Erythrobacter sp.]|nr:2OG-Fe(II) oxygenase [Erythrobacter sp.]
MELRLPPAGDASDALHAEFAATGRCTIPGVLADGDADRLASYLEKHQGWYRIRGFDKNRFDLLPEAERDTDSQVQADHAEIDRYIADDSSQTFAFLYDALPMIPAALAGEPGSPLAALRQALIAFAPELAMLTGLPLSGKVEVQATRYRTGDFLSRHHDGPSDDRKVAMVLGLTRDWCVDWGGNLLFAQGDRLSGYSPGWNRLDLFQVPQDHSVTRVTSSAPAPRLAVSGWFLG